MKQIITLLLMIVFATTSNTWAETFKVDGLRAIDASNATDKPSYFYFNTMPSGYLKVDDKLKTAKWIDDNQYNLETENPIVPPVLKKTDFSFKDDFVIVKGIKILKVKPEERAPIYVDGPIVQSVSILKEINGHTFYLVELMNNGYDTTNYLVDIFNGKVVWSTKVYKYLEYIDLNTWRSSFDGKFVKCTYIHRKGKEPVFMNEYIADKLLATKVIDDKAKYQVDYIGQEGNTILYSLVERTLEKVLSPTIRFVQVDQSNHILLRKEKLRSLDYRIWYYNNQIYALTQDGQIIKNLSNKQEIYINGQKNLGSFQKTSQTFSKYKLPIYQYRGEKYICLEDLSVLGYKLSWDSKEKIGNWVAAKGAKGTIHQFKSTKIYDNDVFARVEGKLYHIYNAEGYSFIKLDALGGFSDLSLL